MSRVNIWQVVYRFWPLLGLLVVTLFPFGWLGEIWPAWGGLLNFFFANNRQHAVGHFVLFGLIGMTVLHFFPGLAGRWGWYLVIMLLFGVGQELFQLLYKQRPLEFDDFRDLLVDLSGAVGAYMLLKVRRRFSALAPLGKLK